MLLAAALLLAACSPLSIVLNTVDSKGVQTVCTSDISLFSHFKIAMGYQISHQDTIMGFYVTCDKCSDHGVFEKGEKLRIRFDDGKEISLSNIYDRKFDKEVVEGETMEEKLNTDLVYSYSPWSGRLHVTPVTYSTFIPHHYTNTVTRSFALYLVNREQLHDILSKNAVKVRIEIEDADCDMPTPSNFCPRVTKLYDYLMMATPMKRSEF